MNLRTQKWIVTIAVPVAFLALFAITFVWRMPSREPRRDGKTLSEWFQLIDTKTGISYDNPFLREIVATGEPATPHILKRYLKSRSWLIKTGRGLSLKWIQQWIRERDEDRLKATVALQLLGPKAHAATPSLVRLLNRQSAFERAETAFLLGRIHSHPELAIPALTNCFTDQNPEARLSAILAIAEFGTNAIGMMPRIRDMLADADAICRQGAATALFALGDSTNRVLPMIQQALYDTNTTVRDFQIYRLGALGERAKPFIPLLILAITNASTDLANRIYSAMEKIDPEAARDLSICF